MPYWVSGRQRVKIYSAQYALYFRCLQEGVLAHGFRPYGEALYNHRMVVYRTLPEKSWECAVLFALSHRCALTAGLNFVAVANPFSLVGRYTYSSLTHL